MAPLGICVATLGVAAVALFVLFEGRQAAFSAKEGALHLAGKGSNSLAVPTSGFLRRGVLSAIRDVQWKTGRDALFIDMGCGYGEVLSLAAPFFERVEGLDLDSATADVAKRKFDNVDNVSVREGDLTKWVRPAGACIIYMYEPLFALPRAEAYRMYDKLLSACDVPGTSEPCYVIYASSVFSRPKISRQHFERRGFVHKNTKRVPRCFGPSHCAVSIWVGNESATATHLGSLIASKEASQIIYNTAVANAPFAEIVTLPMRTCRPGRKDPLARTRP